MRPGTAFSTLIFLLALSVTSAHCGLAAPGPVRAGQSGEHAFCGRTHRHRHHVPAPVSVPPPVVWLSSFAQAQQLALKSGKPILVDYGAVWCIPCHMLENLTFKSWDFYQESNRWICVHVDTDKSAAFSAQMGVESMPSVAMYRPDGTRLGYFVGYEDPQECVASIRRVYPLAISKSPVRPSTGPMIVE